MIETPATRGINTLLSIPDELLLHILSYLDIPELLNFSRTTHHIRLLCSDPVLHTHRLMRASCTIERSIPHRPSLVELMQHRIYVTRTTLAARALGWNLIKIKLNRRLSTRPSASTLVSLNILPAETLSCPKLAPSLIPARRRIERERIKDTLRAFLSDWCRKGKSVGRQVEESSPSVRRIARRFGGLAVANGTAGACGSSVPRERRELPTRAKVLGLRRFWESVGRKDISPCV